MRLETLFSFVLGCLVIVSSHPLSFAGEAPNRPYPLKRSHLVVPTSNTERKTTYLKKVLQSEKAKQTPSTQKTSKNLALNGDHMLSRMPIVYKAPEEKAPAVTPPSVAPVIPAETPAPAAAEEETRFAIPTLPSQEDRRYFSKMRQDPMVFDFSQTTDTMTFDCP